ncbi:unnamed protein product [Macrosiphum euphorbiae]|uniref:Uncharacterized protein n=1 Tax=Macrosiphum euphorbiae TaxID=13131 RepID=A0AAV0XMF8_9HEMI|nr:unnamed protein product [Macrosiphum euphorbiae]CAI6368831.1 unnamed protein product [Macrosiphum euphorbiae]
MFVQIPLTKIKSRKVLHKMEVTHIDELLTIEERRKIAMFYRQEEAKRTRYNPEPSWSLPPTMQAIRRPSATGMTWDDFIAHWEQRPAPCHTLAQPQEAAPATAHEEKAQSPRSSNLSETESEVIIMTIKHLIDRHPESPVEIRKSILKVGAYLKDFENISKTRLRRLIYKEKNQRIKGMKQQYQP